jgi:transcriptional regulator with XRE-family HTH domain
MDARALVARNIRRLRVAKGVSQEALAVDRTYVSRLERGLENPTVAVLDRLAQALDENIVELFLRPASAKPIGPLRPGRKPSTSRAK